MDQRRLVGIDLGVTSAHTVVVVDERGEVVARRRARTARESLEAIEAGALRGAPEGTRLEVVFEPTGMSWLPVAVFFAERGHAVFRVSAATASDMRKVLSRRAKSNSIDAEALARLRLVDTAGCYPLELDRGELGSLRRRVRACDRLTDEVSRRKQRIRDLTRALMPDV